MKKTTNFVIGIFWRNVGRDLPESSISFSLTVASEVRIFVNCAVLIFCILIWKEVAKLLVVSLLTMELAASSCTVVTEPIRLLPRRCPYRSTLEYSLIRSFMPCTGIVRWSIDRICDKPHTDCVSLTLIPEVLTKEHLSGSETVSLCSLMYSIGLTIPPDGIIELESILLEESETGHTLVQLGYKLWSSIWERYPLF